MNIIQGFVGIPSLVNNATGQIAPFGELSQHSMSFTRDFRTYSDKELYPHTEVHTLTAIDEHSSPMVIPKTVIDRFLTIANWIYLQYNSSAIPMNRAKDTLEQAIVTEFPYVRKVSIGELLSTAIPSKRLPDRLSFETEDAGDVYQITLWFSDARFRTQYRYFHIEVIPPVDDINRLIGELADVAVNLNSVKVQAITNRINQYNTQHKVTSILTMPLTWQDPKNIKGKLNTEWTLIIHGNAGSDTDAMKAAIRDYLENKSNYERWMDLFPGLYSANEFILIPFWGNLASISPTYDDGQYTTMTSLSQIQEHRNKYIPNTYRYGQNSEIFLNEHTVVGSVFYRTMIFMAIGNPANKDEAYNFMGRFRDYQAVSTESVDFARMSINTQNFVLKLNEVMNLARIYDPNKGLPSGLTLANKGAREYLGFDFDGFTYFVLTRLGYLREI